MTVTAPGLLDEMAVALLGQRLRVDDWVLLPVAATVPLPALLEEASAHAAHGRLLPAATGRGIDRQFGDVRGDTTLWLDDPACGPAANALMASLQALREPLNRHLMLGIDEVEAHFAHYPAGAAYAIHRDRFHNDDARVLSAVIYLQPDWRDEDGGQLRLHLPDGPRDIVPRGGSAVFFLSDAVEHEVLPAMRSRFSVAAWFRRRPRI